MTEKKKTVKEQWELLIRDKRVEAVCEKDIFMDRFDLYMVCRDRVSMNHFLTPDGIISKEAGTVTSEKLVLAQINTRDAGMLMDTLWNQGIRPSNTKSLDGQIDAMNEHISDLRKQIEYQQESLRAQASVIELLAKNKNA